MLMDITIQMQIHGASRVNIDPDLFRILHEIRLQGTLRSSALTTGISYRHAWGKIKSWEREFKAPLVKLERGRGRGAQLTELGERLLWAEQYLREQLHPKLEPLRQELNASMAAYIRPGGSKIRIFASHGMAVTHLVKLLREDNRFDLDFQIHGSLESLRNLNGGHCQIAGFHLPLQRVGKIIAPQYQQWIIPSRHVLLTVALREQGLMIKKGNPKGITTLHDLTKRSVRFINRQRYSGTRAILDQLLIEEGINTKNINGYALEEFTHVAVAAMIASGAADAGFGIAAAAEQFNLDFIPHLQEAYVLALDKDLNQGLQSEIRKLLQSGAYREYINTLAGYNASESGREISFQHLLALDEDRRTS
jgi:molybdate transport repressor ModE-like protein